LAAFILHLVDPGGPGQGGTAINDLDWQACDTDQEDDCSVDYIGPDGNTGDNTKKPDTDE